MPIANGIDVKLQRANDRSILPEGVFEGANDNKTKRERCISADPRCALQLSLKITRNYEPYTADTLLVAVASSGETANDKYDNASVLVYAIKHGNNLNYNYRVQEYTFADITAPDYDKSYQGMVHQYPDKLKRDSLCSRVALAELRSKDHYITVVIQRGRISADLMARFPALPHATQPASIADITSGEAVLIDPQWFVPLEGRDADVAQVHFRNIERTVAAKRKSSPLRRPSTNARPRHSEDFKPQPSPRQQPPRSQQEYPDRSDDPVHGRTSTSTYDSTNGKTSTSSYITIDDDDNEEEPIKSEPVEEAQVPPAPTPRPYVQEAPITTNDDVASSKTKKFAQLQLKRRKLDLEQRKIELEERQLALEEEMMQVEGEE